MLGGKEKKENKGRRKRGEKREASRKGKEEWKEMK